MDVSRPDLAIVIPAFNEELRLQRALPRIRAVLAARGRRSEVIVVDDGSTDRTADVTREWSTRWSAVRLVVHPLNRGKGAAVRSGVLASHADRVAFTDADLSAPIEQLDVLLDDLADAEIAILSRALPGARIEHHQSAPRETMGKLYAALANGLLLRGVPDPQCGLKVYRGDLARRLFAEVREDGVVFDTEVLLLAARAKARISQRPAVWRHDPETRIPFDLVRALGIAVALWRMKWRHRVLLPVAAAGPIRAASGAALAHSAATWEYGDTAT